MAQNILITGTGREQALGFNFVRRYLEQGDHVIATIRKPSEALERLKVQYPDQLDILMMDVGSTASVEAAAREAAKLVPCLDVLINNAVITSPDYPVHNSFEDSNLDYIAGVIDVGAVGPLRVVKAFLPLLYKSAGTAVVANISSGAGSIGACKNDRDFDYNMTKCALNMGTMILHNKFKADRKIRALCIHPGWMRTNEGNAKAPLDPYENAENMRQIFERRREDFDGPVFLDYHDQEYPG